MEKEIAQLLKEINDFIKRHHMAPSRFGRLYSNNSALVFRLRSGEQSPTFETAASIRKWMKIYDQEKRNDY